MGSLEYRGNKVGHELLIIELGQDDRILFVQMFDFLSNENLRKTLKIVNFVNEWIKKNGNTKRNRTNNHKLKLPKLL